MIGNITIIGLGKFGTALAAALKTGPKPPAVTGMDLRGSAERAAKEKGLTDWIEHNLFRAVGEADAVLLAVPADQTAKTLELAGQDIRPETVVLDWCPVKSAAADWARHHMQHPENFLGVWSGGSSLFIASEPDSSEKAIQAAADLAAALGAERIFTDPNELDGILAAVWHLPQICAGALMDCACTRPGWTEAAKAAADDFSRMTSGLVQNPDQEAPGQTLLNNRENTVRALDEYIARLEVWRNALRDGDESLLRSLTEGSMAARKQCMSASGKSKQPAESTSAADQLKQSLLGGYLRKKIGN